MAESESQKRLVLSRPPKDIEDMSEEELDAYATNLFNAIAGQHSVSPERGPSG